MGFRGFLSFVAVVAVASGNAFATTITVPGDHATIQAAVDAASAGDSVEVGDGVYVETVTVETPLELVAADGAAPTIEGRVNVNAANVVVKGFTITNPNDSFGVIVSADNAIIMSNAFMDIGTAGDTGETQAVYIQLGDDVEVAFNTFDGVLSGPGGGSAKAVLVSDSLGPGLSGTLIYANVITTVDAPAGGAYGVLVGGPVTNLAIQNNIISDLEGAWAHGISLDHDTLNATVQLNEISNVTGTATGFGVGLNLENNTQIPTITVVENNFALLPATTNVGVLNQDTSVTVNAEGNWWGDASGPADPAGSIETSVGNCSVSAVIDRNADGIGAAAPGTDFHPLAGYVDYCPWSTVPFVVVVEPPPPPPPLPAASSGALILLASIVVISGLVRVERSSRRSHT